jgi:spore photoproduct lyase
MRRHKPEGLSVAKNIGDILTAINIHAHSELMQPTFEKPNQTDPEYVTYDISCNEDFALHHKYYDWERIFQFFKDHPIAKATLATKTIPKKFLEFNPERKVRIRFSMMPQLFSGSLEPNTAMIIDRLKAVNDFYKAGYDVHLNFSPVIWHLSASYECYKQLFELIDKTIEDDIKPHVLAEVIFLTHNKDMHEYNMERGIQAECLLWEPELQEEKTSEYGGKNLRYKVNLKQQYIEEFIELHDEIIPWNKIRYIF